MANNKYAIECQICAGCGYCEYVCESKCISGEVNECYVIDQECCTGCGECFNICPLAAIYRSA